MLFATGQSGYLHEDLAAIKAGAKSDGGIFVGRPVLPGYEQIIEPGETVSIILVLEDGSVAVGDCTDVILAGAAGRDRIFKPKEHLRTLENELRPRLIGRNVSRFRSNANEFDALVLDGKRMHMALRYGVSQALLNAVAIAQRTTMAEVVADEFGTTISDKAIPILASCQRDDPLQLDRTILKRPELLPHADFSTVEQIGYSGEKLKDYAGRIAARLTQIGGDDYRPRIHLDIYGTLGDLFANDIGKIADYLLSIADTVRPYEFIVESPIIAQSRDQQVELYSSLRSALIKRGSGVKVIVDEWCNTLEDIKIFVDEKAADFAQVKVPDLGGISNTIEAILYCKKHYFGVALGGSANETDQSARICTHIGLACRPDFMLSKPGLGVDEALMIQRNEMARTLALVASRKG